MFSASHNSRSASLNPVYASLSSGNSFLIVLTTHAGMTLRLFLPSTP